MYINSMQQRVKIHWVSPRVGFFVSVSSLVSFPGIAYNHQSMIKTIKQNIKEVIFLQSKPLVFFYTCKRVIRQRKQ